MATDFLPYNINQLFLLPPNLRDWLPEGHLALFLLDVVEALDLSEIERAAKARDSRGRAGYAPRMMVALLMYAYCTGKPSSRKIEKATHEDVAFRVIAANQHPDHDCIADFRKRHLAALAGLFVQVLRLCQKAGLVKLGHIAIDGTKIQANASKHKAMSYDRMAAAEKKLEEEIAALLEEAERVDAEEDAKYGKGKRIDELPKDLQRRQGRREKILEYKAALEREAKEKAQSRDAEAEVPGARDGDDAPTNAEADSAECVASAKITEGAPDKEANTESAEPAESMTATPAPKAQRNFTDPESRIMPDSSNKGSFVQGYNVQIAVDGAAQVIVATAVTQATNDKRELVPMAKRIIENCGRLADATSADAGYFSESAVTDPTLAGTLLLVPPNKQKHGTLPVASAASKSGARGPAAERMRQRLATDQGRELYRMRKAIVEPVFGQIKEVRRFRRFLLRGAHNVRCEFDLIALTHNLLKLFRYKSRASPALLSAAA